MPNNHYQPANLLWSAYDPANAPHAFRAGNLTDARDWQARTRAAFTDTLGLHKLPDAPPEVSAIQVVDKGDYLRHKMLLRTTPYSVMPFYLLVPKYQPQPLPTVVAFNGHGYGVADIVGLWEDGTERNRPSGYHKDFAVMLCRAGFVVAAPEISCFGERQNDYSYLDTINDQPVPSTCHHSSMLALHLGLSVAGIRVH
ncbi:MAG: alpha/beta hydrolase family protein, partial [Chloroflexota bacterium]